MSRQQDMRPLYDINRPGPPVDSMGSLKKDIDKILEPIFSYGIDWTEQRDKSGPNGDHDVSVFAGQIKADMRNQTTTQIINLIESVLPSPKMVTKYSGRQQSLAQGWNNCLKNIKSKLIGKE